MTVQYLDINKNYISDGLTKTITGEPIGVLNLDLQDYITGFPVTAAYVRATFTGPAGAILQNQDYRIYPSCSQPIFVEYLNSLGAYEQYKGS